MIDISQEKKDSPDHAQILHSIVCGAVEELIAAVVQSRECTLLPVEWVVARPLLRCCRGCGITCIFMRDA
jgi:hypothetical protein